MSYSRTKAYFETTVTNYIKAKHTRWGIMYSLVDYDTKSSKPRVEIEVDDGIPRNMTIGSRVHERVSGETILDVTVSTEEKEGTAEIDSVVEGLKKLFQYREVKLNESDSTLWTGPVRTYNFGDVGSRAHYRVEIPYERSERPQDVIVTSFV